MQKIMRAQGHSAVCRTKMEELLQGIAKAQQRLEEAEHRTRDTASEWAGKRIKPQFADRPVDLPRAPVQIPATALHGWCCRCWQCRCRGAAQDAVQNTDERRTSSRVGQDDAERAKRQRSSEDRIGDGSVKCGRGQGQSKWSRHGIYAERKGREGWDSCANSSAASQTIQ